MGPVCERLSEPSRAERRRIDDHSCVIAPAAATSAPSTGRAPALADVAWIAAITAVKSAIVALAVDAAVNSDQPRFSGKAMKVRAIGYVGALLIVPVVWRLRGRDEPYPRELDLLVSLPLLVDAGGNAVGMYQNAHVDDAIHFANGALLAGVVGAVAMPRTRTAWEAATFATAVGTAAAAAWEMFEWTAAKLGARGMDLTYDDTMEDLIETSAGALLGGLITLLRHPTRLRSVPGRAGDPILVRRP
jgi:predicted membrane protein DUF2238